MFTERAEDPKFGSKGKTGRICLKMRSQGRIASCFKYGVILLVFWFFGYIYVSTYKSELLEAFKKEDLNIAQFQAKISELADKGFNKFNQQQQMAQLIENEKVEENVEEKIEEKSEKPFYEVDDGITEEAYQFMKDLGLRNPGENGVPIELPKNLSEDIQKRIKEGYDTHGYNAFLSSMISLNRHIPDIRSEVCKSKNYTNLPKCSIVIPFHNEDWMLLMRTVHSVLNRTPLELVEEILLVDDASDRGECLSFLQH